MRFSRSLSYPPRRWVVLALCGGLLFLGLGGIAVVSVGDSSRGAEAPDDKTIGLVLSRFDYQFYITKDGKEECPDGLVHSSRANWQAQFPTRAAREAHFNRCGAIDHRGPNCESVLAAPQLIKDPLPYREVKGTKSYGVNLDGTEDGRATATTCAHRKFISPDGKSKNIDNQYYRLLGCQVFAHNDLIGTEIVKRRITDSRHQRALLEIQGVDDLRNDAHVEVVVYQGRDPLVVDVENNAVPWQSQRIDESAPPQRLRGRIVEGELITEPADVAWRDVAYALHIGDLYYAPPVLVRGTQLRLRLTSTGAEGLRSGYVDTAQWWQVRKIGAGFNSSPPAMYEALHRLADGYKDSQTGNCTGLSSAMKLEFVRAYIRHPVQEGNKAVNRGTNRRNDAGDAS